MKPRISIVIGRGYGDEGKGLVTDYLAADSLYSSNSLVIRHNGGAQSGHTVELEDKRFVFHELSSGSMRKSDTFWASTYLPDLFKLSEELEDFKKLTGFAPKVFADKKTNITIIYDVFINMIIETSRGDSRHGSCGMGINEADLRNKAGFGLTIGEVAYDTTSELVLKLLRILNEYVPVRLKELNISEDDMGEFKDLLYDDNVLYNFASKIKENVSLVSLVDNVKEFICSYSHVIFESGQGLLLDADYEESLPHVTASKTGLTNPFNLLKNLDLTIDEVYYVTRSYVTKHGAGYFKNECKPEDIGSINMDKTNIHNAWQGSIRYGKYDSIDDILKPVIEDLKTLSYKTKNTLIVTHLNETSGAVVFKDKAVDIKDFANDSKIKETFDFIGTSYSGYGADISLLRI